MFIFCDCLSLIIKSPSLSPMDTDCLTILFFKEWVKPLETRVFYGTSLQVTQKLNVQKFKEAIIIVSN